MFRNKLVCVTGGSRGIGQAIANVFAQQGASVAGKLQQSQLFDINMTQFLMSSNKQNNNKWQQSSTTLYSR